MSRTSEWGPAPPPCSLPLAGWKGSLLLQPCSWPPCELDWTPKSLRLRPRRLCRSPGSCSAYPYRSCGHCSSVVRHCAQPAHRPHSGDRQPRPDQGRHFFHLQHAVQVRLQERNSVSSPLISVVADIQRHREWSPAGSALGQKTAASYLPWQGSILKVTAACRRQTLPINIQVYPMRRASYLTRHETVPPTKLHRQRQLPHSEDASANCFTAQPQLSFDTSLSEEDTSPELSSSDEFMPAAFTSPLGKQTLHALWYRSVLGVSSPNTSNLP